MTNSENYNSLQQIFRKYTLSNKDISLTSDIYKDLGISGDDADDVFIDIRNKHYTDFTGIVFNDFFPNETDGLLFYLVRLFQSKPSFKVLTFGHLLDVVNAGVWFEPDNPPASKVGKK